MPNFTSATHSSNRKVFIHVDDFDWANFFAIFDHENERIAEPIEDPFTKIWSTDRLTEQDADSRIFY